MDNLDDYPKQKTVWTYCDECGSRISSNMYKMHICEPQQKMEREQWKEMHEDDSAVAFRYMAMYLNDRPASRVLKDDPYKNAHRGSSGWMGA